MALCTDISLVKHLPDNMDLLRVTIDGNVVSYWIFNYAESAKYLNQEVIVDYRQDILDGKFERFITTFTVPTVVQTIDAVEDFKLYTDAEDNHSNTSFADIQPGENASNCVIYCVKSEYKSSPKAVWHELTVRDRGFRIATVRIFDYDVKNLELAGSYIVCDLSRNKYGFQTDFVRTVDQECPPNPEIALAKAYITNLFKSNDVANKYIERYDLLNNLLQAFDIEFGYGMVRMAMELSIANSMRNVSNDINLDVVQEAILAQYGYLARNSKLSAEVNNIIMAMSFQWRDKDLLLQLLDPSPKVQTGEYAVMQQIRKLVDTLLKVRKGIEE